MNKADQCSLVEVSNKKWPKNENDPQDDEYELAILKYDVNQDALVEQKEGIPYQEENKPITPSQLAIEEGEDSKIEDEKSFESCSGVIIDSWHQTKGGSPSYV